MVKSEFELKRLIGPADYVTLANAASGTTAILLALLGLYGYAAAMLLLALIFDVLDGTVARALKKGATAFGKELDSLADIVSFGVAPAVLMAIISPGKFSVLVAIIFVLSGVVRLARFNIMDIKDSFIGIPIPTSALLLPLLIWTGVPLEVIPWAMLVLAILMNSPFKIKKPSIYKR